MPRYVLEVMYDGTAFNGSQIQGEQPTVQLEINKALSTLFRTPLSSFGASRTDEGVHALCNYYHFDVPESSLPAEPHSITLPPHSSHSLGFDLLYKCNSVLPGTLAVKKVYRAPDDFNARFDAISRRYRYRIYAKKNPFLLNRALFYPFKLNEDILNETAAIIKEYEHFESFSKRNAQSKTFLCNIKESYWEHVGEELHYVVEGNRFLRGMVRGLVGTQLHIARERASIADFRKIIESKDCTNAFFDVGGWGLYLEEIFYKEGTLTAM